MGSQPKQKSKEVHHAGHGHRGPGIGRSLFHFAVFVTVLAVGLHLLPRLKPESMELRNQLMIPFSRAAFALDDALARSGLLKRWELFRSGHDVLMSVAKVGNYDDLMIDERKIVVSHSEREDIPIDIRIYSPKVGEESPKVQRKLKPALIWAHGGGFVFGNKDTAHGFCTHLSLQTDLTIISVDYRLSPEFKYPVPVLDLYHSVKWVVENAKLLGVDSQRLLLGGDSAGGNLAVAVGLMLRNERRRLLSLKKDIPESSQSASPKFPLNFNLQALMIVYPVLQTNTTVPSRVQNSVASALSSANVELFSNEYIRDQKDTEDPYCMPLNAESFKDLPPTYVLTCDNDPLRDDGAELARRLAKDSVAVVYESRDDCMHAFLNLYDTFLEFGAMKDILRSMVEFVTERVNFY
eukprot:Nk52_evm41s1705 gene=Nk52_evmTU41s1705